MTFDHLRGFVTSHPQLFTVPLVAAVTWCVLVLAV